MKRIERRPFQKYLIGRPPEKGGERSARMLREVSAYERGRRIRALLSLDLSALTDDQITRRIGSAFHGYMNLVAHQISNFAFRARINETSAPFQNATELWYPPARIITSLGRFNREGKPVFYGSSSGAGAVREVTSNTSAIATILVVGAKEENHSTDAIRLGFQMAPQVLERMGNEGLIGDERLQAILQHYNIMKPWIEVDKAIGKIVTTDVANQSDKSHYRMTCSLGEWITSSDSSQSLVYPSVATLRNEANFCMSPSVADETFFPAEAWMVEMQASDLITTDGRNGVKIDMRVIRQSKSIGSDGSILWVEEGEKRPISDLRDPTRRIERYRKLWLAGDQDVWARVIAER